MLVLALVSLMLLPGGGPGDPGDEVILRWMGPGRMPDPFGEEGTFRTVLPPEFWGLPGSAGALAFAERNRTRAHRRAFGLEMAGSGSIEMPERVTVRLTVRSSRCFLADDCHYQLRVEPGAAFLAWARVCSGGALSREWTRDWHVYDFGLEPVPEADARAVARAILSLPGLRVVGDLDGREEEAVCSTADGRAVLEVIGNGVPSLGCEGNHVRSVSYLWRHDIDDRIRLNLAAYLIGAAWPERLGLPWSYERAAVDLGWREFQSGAAEACRERDARVRTAARALLDAASDSPDRVSPAILETVVQAAGDLGATELAERIERLHTRRGGPDPLRAARALALVRLGLVEDVRELSAVARAHSEIAPWAAGRLALDHPRLYDELLSEWAREGGPRGREALKALAETNLEAAVTVARELPLDRCPEMAPDAFATLRRAGDREGLDEAARALAAIVLDERADERLRWDALAASVPRDDPGLIPGEWLDRTLEEILHRKPSSTASRFSLRAAAIRALGQRGRPRARAAVRACLETEEDPAVLTAGLEAAAHLLGPADDDLRPALVRGVRRLLADERRGYARERLAWIAFEADARELGPDLRSTSTSGPDDLSGPASFHLNRQILSVWRTRDPALRAKLLTAFAFEQAYWFLEPQAVGRRARLIALLKAAGRSLGPDGHREVLRFLEKCEGLSWPRSYGTEVQEWRGRLASLIREALAR